MAKEEINLELELERVHVISTDYCTQEDLAYIYSDGDEEHIDIRVFNLMENLYQNEKIVSQGLRDAEVYSYIKSKNKTGKRGRSDITLYNYFNNNSIDILIENKFDKTKDNPIKEAIGYCEDINSSGKYTCRVAIGFNPFASCQVITKVLSVDGAWEDLIVNGKTINGFIGQELLQLVYSNAGITNFKLNVKQEERFTRAEFRKILDTDLPVIFRKMTNIANNDALKISFTVAFISLKVILEKQENLGKPIKDESGRIVIWRNTVDKIAENNVNSLRNVSDIKAAVDAIAGVAAQNELKNKYKYIFQLNEIFSFNDLVDNIREAETKNHISQENSSINKMKNIIDKIKSQSEYHYEFDLFGEVYEALADDKTKSDLGAYFTKRHIIRPIVNLLLKPSDIEEIINEGKTICDPFCGTGGMLTESFKHIKIYCNEKYPDKDTSEVASRVIFGYDVIDLNVSKTKINMTLAEDGYSIIDSRDSLTTLGMPDQYCEGKLIPVEYDYIITNVPYGVGDKNGIVHNLGEKPKLYNNSTDRDKMINRVLSFEMNNNIQKSEYNALIKVVQLLKEGGKAIVIIPDGLLENPSFSKMREWFLVKCKIEQIISLPKFAFAPYTKEKTYAVIFQKRKTNVQEELVQAISDIDIDEKFYAYIIDNDGYANSDKQYETDLRDKENRPLHNEVTPYTDIYGDYHPSLLEQVCKSRKEDVDEHYDEWGRKIEGKKYGYIYIRDVLKDFYYHGDRETEANKVYRLNLLPEKYFRQAEYENLTLDELVLQRKKIENELRELFGGIAND